MNRPKLLFIAVFAIPEDTEDQDPFPADVDTTGEEITESRPAFRNVGPYNVRKCAAVRTETRRAS